MSLLRTIRQTITGAVILDEWFGSGGEPVPKEKADARARVCVDCEENREPRWWEIHTNAIALWIRRALAIRKELGLETSRDDQIGMCRKCGCCLKLKVHVPIEHIQNHVPAFTLREYPAHCWQRIETSI